MHFYDVFPGRLIGDFLWAGLDEGESAVVIATPEHAEEVRTDLTTRRGLPATTERSGRLQVFDARQMLDEIMVGDLPSPERFLAAAGRALARGKSLAPGRTVRVYSEMILLLGEQHNTEGILAIERLWKALTAADRLSVYCAYPMQQFGDSAQADTFRRICEAHTDVVPVLTTLEEPERHALCIATLQQQALVLQRQAVLLEARVAENDRLCRQSARALRVQSEADRHKDQFLAMLGHELRNPLAPILTAVQLMDARGDPDTKRERDVIYRQAQHLTHLVDDLLDISRVTRGKVELRRERVEIWQVLLEAIEAVSPLLDQKAHELSIAVPHGGLAVCGDPFRLAQIFRNLITNAAKYTHGRGHISLAAREEDGMVTVEVTDDGCGISDEMMPAIFEPFVQNSRTIDRAQGGLGLGLALVKAMTELHEGAVSVWSGGLDQGSTFTVRLPALGEAAAPTSTADAAMRATAAPAAPHHARLLVVDDNRDAAEMLSEVLRASGYQVEVAFDGAEALARASAAPPDIALVDIGLPVMDGYELAGRLRQGRPDVRLIALTGYGQDSDRERSHAAGFNVHMVKPVDLDSLLHVLGDEEQAQSQGWQG